MQKKEETKKSEVVEATEVTKAEEKQIEAERTGESAESVNGTEKETVAHKAKRYLRVVLIFVVFFVGGSFIGSLISEFFTFDKVQQELLKEEIAEIGTLTNEETYDLEALNAMLDETVTSDEYVPLEKALKAFTKDVITVNVTVDTAMSSEMIEAALTANNISADGPDFTNTLTELNSVYATLETAKADFEALMTEEKVLSYLPEDTDEELVAVYTEIVSGIKMTPTDKRYISMIESIDKMLEIIDAERAALNYLVENKDSWELKDGYIYFDTMEHTNEYNELLVKFSEVTAE